MAAPEVRLDRLRPAEIAAAMARAPVAWIPMGALALHADHLPNGTDGITGQGLLVRAAERLGGVVLPWSYLTLGTLALPWSFRFELVRRQQTAGPRLPVGVEAGPHEVALAVGLAGVTEDHYAETVHFR